MYSTIYSIKKFVITEIPQLYGYNIIKHKLEVIIYFLDRFIVDILYILLLLLVLDYLILRNFFLRLTTKPERSFVLLSKSTMFSILATMGRQLATL